MISIMTITIILIVTTIIIDISIVVMLSLTVTITITFTSIVIIIMTPGRAETQRFHSIISPRPALHAALPDEAPTAASAGVS